MMTKKLTELTVAEQLKDEAYIIGTQTDSEEIESEYKIPICKLTGKDRDDIKNIESELMTKEYVNITSDVAWELNGYYPNGDLSAARINTDAAKTSIIPVYEGEKYKISGISNYNQKLICIYAADNSILLMYSPDNERRTYTGLEITIPTGGVKIGVAYFNEGNTDALSQFKLWKEIYVAKDYVIKGEIDKDDVIFRKRAGVSDDFVNGYINGSGELVTYAKSLCSVRYFNYNTDNMSRVVAEGNYKFTIFAWDASGVYQGYLTTEGTFQKTGGTVARVQEFDFTSYKSYYIRLGVTNPISDGYEDITPSEAINITFVYYDNYSEITNSANIRKIKKATGSWTYNEGQVYYSLKSPSIRAVSIIEITAPCTVVFNAGSGKYIYVVYDGTIYNATQLISVPSWITSNYSLQITDVPKVVVAQFANSDGTTPVDLETFDGYMAVSDYSSKDNYSLYGKRLSVIGDSIASFTGYISPGSTAYYPRSDVTRWQDMFWGVLASRNNMVVDVIDAYAGSCVADKWQSLERVSFIDNTRLSRLGTPDYIIVEGGINDFGGNPLGDYPAGSYTNTYEFRTAYSYLLNELKQRYPDAKIVCLSLMTARTYNNTQFPEKQTEVIQSQATDTTPHYLYEFNASIKEIAARYECIFCDISDVMNYYVSSTLGVHPEAAGHLAIAKRIEALIK